MGMYFWEGKCVGERGKRKVGKRELLLVGFIYISVVSVGLWWIIFH